MSRLSTSAKWWWLQLISIFYSFSSSSTWFCKTMVIDHLQDNFGVISLSLSLFLRHFSVLTEVEAVLMVVLHLDICFQWANRLKNIRYFIYFFVALLSSESWWFFSLHKNSCNKNHSIWKKRWLMVRLVRACGDEESKEPRELLFFISFDQGWQNQSIFVLKRVFSSGPTLKCTGYHIHF